MWGKFASRHTVTPLSGIRKDRSMFRRFLPVWVILSSIAGPSARAQMPFATNLVPARTSLERLGLERHWFVVVPMVETERLLRISRTETMLFAQTNYAKLHAYDAETGRRLWTAALGERMGFARGVAANSWAVFVTNANMLYSLDRGTGRTLWKTNLGTIPTSTPACSESRVWVGMTDGMLMGFLLKRTDAKGNEFIRDTPYPLWNWHAGQAITTRSLPAENLLAFGGGDGKAYVVMVEEPTVIFRLPTGGAIGEGLGASGTRTLLVPSADFVLYAVDLITAEMHWTFPSGAPIAQEPLVADQDVYTINTEGNLSSLDPVTGTRRWTVATQGGRLASVSATKLYLRSYNLDLFVIDRATGRMVTDPSETHLRAGLNLRDYDLDIVNRFNDRICFATSSGLVIALREIGQTPPRPLRDPKLPPFGYIPPEGLKVTPPTPPAAEPGAGAAGEEPAPAVDKEAAPKEEPEKPPQ
jgi:outer membrane protein assembly factor BamB